jgi:hypothetical protein
MSQFPNIPQMFQNTDKYGSTGILQRYETFYLDAVTPNQQFWSEASVDTRFYAGDQSVWNEYYGNTRISNNRQFNFNLIRPVVEMISGYQRRNRKSTVVVPVSNADDHTADQFTKILMWQANQEGTLETISEAFQGALISGMNLLQVWVDYRADPISGDIKVTNRSYNTVVLDPYFKRQDLSDCRFIMTRSYMSKQEIASLLPDNAAQVMNMDAIGNRDGKFQYMPETYNYNMNNLLMYDEFYYRDYREQKLIVDERTGATMEWTGTDEELKMYLYAMQGVSVVNQTIPTVKMAIIVQGQVMYDGPNPLGIDEYGFVPVLAYYTPELPYLQFRMQGVVRCLRDAQYLYNRRKIIELDILESQINSGWIAKEDSVVDPQELYKTGQGQVIWKKSHTMPEDLIQVQAAQVPPSMFQASDNLADLINKISGANEELMGSAVDDKAGILSMLRQGAGLTTLQRLFDQLDFSQKLLGRIMIQIIQANFAPGKIGMILSEEPSERFFSKNFGRYDAAVEEGFNTSTQRQMQFAQLLHLREVGINIPEETIINAATLQDKRDLIEQLKQQQQQQQQMQQAQAQSEMQEQQATIQMAQARADADRGLAEERKSRVSENQALAVERMSQAYKEEEEALLNKVKILKELQSIDLTHLEKLNSLARSMKQEEHEDIIRHAAQQSALMREMENSSNNNRMQEQAMAAQPPVMEQVDRGQNLAA